MRAGIPLGAVLVCGCVEKDPDYGNTSDGAGDGDDTGTAATSSADDGSGDGGSVDDTSGGGSSGTMGVDESTGGGSTSGATSGGSTGGASSSTTTGTSGGTTTTGTTGGIETPCSELWAGEDWTLEPPELLPGLSEAGFDGDPYLSADGLTLYFASDRDGDPDVSDIFHATRANRDAPFLNIQRVDDVNTVDSEWTFAVTEDGLLAYFNSNRPGGAGNADLWQVERASTAMPWGNPQPITELNTTGAEWDAFTSPDGLTVHFNRGGPDADNWRAERASRSDPFTNIVPMPVINTTDTDASPTLSEDRLLVVYVSFRPEGLGSGDLWYATRAAPNQPFDPPKHVPVINTAESEGESHLRYDGCELFFTTGPVAAGIEGWDLYRTELVPL